MRVGGQSDKLRLVDRAELIERMKREKLRVARYRAEVAEQTTPAALAKKIAQATGPLTFLDGTTPVVFRDGSYRWVRVKRFFIDEKEPAHRLLAALLLDPHYRDTYIVIGSETSDPIHGPYDLENITTATFENIDRARALSIFRTWADEWGPVPADQIEGDLGLIETLIQESDTRYLLPDLGETARHEFGDILPRFLEFILINSQTRELRIVVLTAD
jgi:hypothetical protein